MWTLLPPLHRTFHTWAYDYMVNMVREEGREEERPLTYLVLIYIYVCVCVLVESTTTTHSLTHTRAHSRPHVYKHTQVDPLDNYIHRGGEAFLTGATPEGMRCVFVFFGLVVVVLLFLPHLKKNACVCVCFKGGEEMIYVYINISGGGIVWTWGVAPLSCNHSLPPPLHH